MEQLERKSLYLVRKESQNLQEEYKNVPDVSIVSAKDSAYINECINKIGNNVTNLLRNATTRNVKQFAKDFNEVISVRNNNAHSLGEDNEEEIQANWNKVFSALPQMQEQTELLLGLHSEKERRRFEKFGSDTLGDSTDRSQLVDAIADSLNSELTEEEKIDFPENELAQNTKEIIEETFNTDELKKYIGSHNGISQNVQTDILDWIKESENEITQTNPFIAEECFVSKLSESKSESIAKDIKKLASEYQKLQSVQDFKSNANLAFYKKEFTALEEDTKDNKKKNKTNDRQDALVRALQKDLWSQLTIRKNNWRLQKIDELRRDFIKQLKDKLERFQKLEQQLKSLIKNLGYLWDLSKTDFADYGFDVLEKYADLLENDASLKELADLLGRQNKEQEKFEKEIREKTILTTEFETKPAYKGQICGVTQSNDISSVLPSELSLWKNPVTKKLFELKFAQKQLISFDYENIEKRIITQKELEEVSVSKLEKEKKGPVIICVDTSGSMHGTPENIAKTITFALAKVAIEEHRKCYLISFSTSIETLDLTEKNEKSIANLVSFLRMNFYGGTDATPALLHSIELLQKNEWENADVLMVSDFVMSDMPEQTTLSIESQKKKQTKFYSLVIGQSGNTNAIQCFNHNWSYNMYDPNASRRLVEQINEIKRREDS